MKPEIHHPVPNFPVVSHPTNDKLPKNLEATVGCGVGMEHLTTLP